MSLGQRSRYYRLKLGWKLEDLSDKSGVDIGTISALEVRNSQRSKYAAPIARAFGLSVEQLLDEQRDWLSPPPATAAAQHLFASEAAPPPYHAPSRWLFSAELFDALRRKRAPELRHIENIIRAYLQLQPLDDAGNTEAA